VEAIYGIWKTSLKSPEFQAVEREMEPKLAAFQDEIVQNGPLFQRIETVYAARETSGLTPEQQRLASLAASNYDAFAATSPTLPGAAGVAINQRLASPSPASARTCSGTGENDFVTSRKAELRACRTRKTSAAAAGTSSMESG
jgi:peptidyl-dipeptidase Dcp